MGITAFAFCDARRHEQSPGPPVARVPNKPPKGGGGLTRWRTRGAESLSSPLRYIKGTDKNTHKHNICICYLRRFLQSRARPYMASSLPPVK